MFQKEALEVCATETKGLETTTSRSTYSSPRLVELGEAARLVQGESYIMIHPDMDFGYNYRR